MINYLTPCQPQAQFAVNNSSNTQTWLLDNGASHHVTANLNNLSLHTPYTSSDDIMIGDGTGLPITHTSSTSLKTPSTTFTLNNVLCELRTEAILLKGQTKDGVYECEKQISSLIMKRPNTFLLNAQKNFKPKLEYFKSLGFSEEEIAQILSSCSILDRSLENQIIPAIQVIKSIVGTNKDVLKAIKSWFLVVKSDRLSEVVSEVEKMGLDPTNKRFMSAIHSMALMSKSLWEQKLGVYSSFGLSKDDIIATFKLEPLYMNSSKEKIRKSMSFFVHQLKLKPKVISKHPTLLLFSLEKRIVPRCAVLQLLMSKNLIKGDLSLISALKMIEKMFMVKFVSKYQNVIPEVIEARQGNIQFQGFPFNLRT
ncbi:uncharacterized protein LOC132281155 [Cornus florida]|uniref:uncharacterized protein LOC132281155 n=1 Tax=Cornus florida TaxID=4283 RepID=UPI00289C0D50|nr:uncharacterized protein LOC132281155 [Cornus florida]